MNQKSFFNVYKVRKGQSYECARVVQSPWVPKWRTTRARPLLEFSDHIHGQNLRRFLVIDPKVYGSYKPTYGPFKYITPAAGFPSTGLLDCEHVGVSMYCKV